MNTVGSMDFSIVYRKLFRPVLVPALHLLKWAALLLAAVLYELIRGRVNPFQLSRVRLAAMRPRLRVVDFLRWKLVDLLDARKHGREFSEYGLTLYCGRQGSGKTVSMIHYLEWVRKTYPDCIIVTNFEYKYSNYRMESWRDFFDIRNGEQGVVFVIDEIHSEYSANSWKDFPEALLSEISQQRKQRVKIVASSQVFSRVVKPIREQSATVVLCSTIAGRWTRNREYDAREYEVFCDSATAREKLRTLRRTSFIQSDELRGLYDTYEKIKRLAKQEFIPRNERAEA